MRLVACELLYINAIVLEMTGFYHYCVFSELREESSEQMGANRGNVTGSYKKLSGVAGEQSKVSLRRGRVVQFLQKTLFFTMILFILIYASHFYTS